MKTGRAPAWPDRVRFPVQLGTWTNTAANIFDRLFIPSLPVEFGVQPEGDETDYWLPG
jgi:hypothetical protein